MDGCEGSIVDGVDGGEDGCEDGGVDGVVDSGLDGEQVKFGYNIKVLNINRQQASMCLTATLFLMTGI